MFATPIAARKLARLGVEQDRVVLRPAFYRQLGEAYGALAQATCALSDHEAPDADCSCGFYAVADDTQLWRLGADEPELGVVDVELSGRVIEHDHGYRASHQRVTHVQFHGVCVRCGKRAETFAQRRFGGLVPSCRRCAPRPVEPEEVSASLEVPVSFSTDEPAPASIATRLRFVLAQMAAPVLILSSPRSSRWPRVPASRWRAASSRSWCGW